MILNHGRLGTAGLLKPDTVREMGRNQTGEIKVRLQPVASPGQAKPYPLGAGEDVWGLGFQLAAPTSPARDMRRPGSMSWAGINNTFFWIDPQAGVGCVVLMEFLPFYDDAALQVLKGVETRLYRHLVHLLAGFSSYSSASRSPEELEQLSASHTDRLTLE
jgi:CubicO group peptidase (beta-lactamase class C family)